MKNTIILLTMLQGFLCFAQAPKGSFKPEYGKKYLVSAWVKEAHTTQQIAYANSDLVINFLANSSTEATFTFSPSGPIIDGWQRIVGIITVPAEVPGSEMEVEIRLINSGTGFTSYFDDIRFLPYNGSLKSFVYDNETLKLVAELDENNYATFYEYDMEGGLIRVKRETEKGVYTIQETRSKNAKNAN